MAKPAPSSTMAPTLQTTQAVQSAVTEIATTVIPPKIKAVTAFVRTIILGQNIEVDSHSDNNTPDWFYYIIIAGCMVCCFSCTAWVICALFFFKKERKCTHTIHMVVVDEPSKPSKSPKKEHDDPQDDPPKPQENGSQEPNGSFTNPLTPDVEKQGDQGYARSSKRSSRKEGPGGGGDSKKSAKSSSKSPSSNITSKKSQKSDRNEGGKECAIEVEDLNFDRSGVEQEQVGWLGKISRAMFFSRDY